MAIVNVPPEAGPKFTENIPGTKLKMYVSGSLSTKSNDPKIAIERR